MGYWLWRSVKTVFFTCIYYVLLFCSGFIFYPYGEMLDVSRGDKLLVGLQSGIFIVFISIVGSIVVTGNKKIKEETLDIIEKNEIIGEVIQNLNFDYSKSDMIKNQTPIIELWEDKILLVALYNSFKEIWNEPWTDFKRS